MNANETLEYFRKTYPNKNIVVLPENDPAEIICEVDPTGEHPEYNTAIAAIKASAPHYHRVATETYKILQGTLNLYVNGRHVLLREGESCVIKPGEVHYAKGDFTIVEVVSQPGWTFEDHILANLEVGHSN